MALHGESFLLMTRLFRIGSLSMQAAILGGTRKGYPTRRGQARGGLRGRATTGYHGAVAIDRPWGRAWERRR